MILQYTAAEFKFGINFKYSVNGRIFAMIFNYTFSVLIWADSLQVSLIQIRGQICKFLDTKISNVMSRDFLCNYYLSNSLIHEI
jgi:hypothetical protein